MRNVALAPVEIDYPVTDGVPMAETDAQGIPLMYAVTGLRDYFRHRHDVYVSGNLLIYYEEGNPNTSVAPDVFVVIGVPSHTRPIYKVWEEGKGPDFVLEITSRHTRDRDEGPKRALYESLGVQEYWQYDPTGDYLEPPLRGLRLEGGAYRSSAPTWTEDETLVMFSPVLGLELRVAGGELRFRDPVSGENVRTLTESNEELQRAERERQREVAARQQEAAARQRAEQGLKQAEQERLQQEQARQRAESRLAQETAARHREAEARRTAEARVAQLEALLRRND